MSTVAIRELRNNTRQLLERVERGEAITITIDGRPAAELRTLRTRPTFMDRRSFASAVLEHRADPELADVLAELAPQTTDDLSW